MKKRRGRFIFLCPEARWPCRAGQILVGMEGRSAGLGGMSSGGCNTAHHAAHSALIDASLMTTTENGRHLIQNGRNPGAKPSYEIYICFYYAWSSTPPSASIYVSLFYYAWSSTPPNASIYVSLCVCKPPSTSRAALEPEWAQPWGEALA